MVPLPIVAFIVSLSILAYGVFTDNTTLVLVGLVLMIVTLEMDAILSALKRLAELVKEAMTPTRLIVKG